MKIRNIVIRVETIIWMCELGYRGIKGRNGGIIISIDELEGILPVMIHQWIVKYRNI